MTSAIVCPRCGLQVVAVGYGSTGRLRDLVAAECELSPHLQDRQYPEAAVPPWVTFSSPN